MLALLLRLGPHLTEVVPSERQTLLWRVEDEIWMQQVESSAEISIDERPTVAADHLGILHMPTLPRLGFVDSTHDRRRAVAGAGRAAPRRLHSLQRRPDI